MPFVIDIDPVAFRLGDLGIRWYGIIVVLALAGGLWIAHRGTRRIGIDDDTFDAGVLWVLVASVVGARALYILQNGLGMLASDPLHLLMIWEGGLSFYGGIIGAAIALAIFARRRGLSLARLGDLAAPAAAAGQAIGHFGCLISGDSFGVPTTLPWAVVYRNPGAMAPLGVPLHPTQVYEAIAVGLLFLFLWFGRPAIERLGPGAVAATYLVGLSAIRFGLFFLRDEAPVLLGLKTAQWIGLGLGAAGAVVLVALLLQRSRATPSLGASEVSRS